MSRVEEQYRAGIASWSGTRRVERSAALLSEMRAALALRARRQAPESSATELAVRVAEQLYRSDPETLRLLARLS